MSILHDKFTNIENLDDLQPLVSETEDGESTTIEFKSITEGIKKPNLGESKALLAKEICAFLNSNDGILVWGAEKGTDGKITILNKGNVNLEEIFDRQLENLVEPLPSGIEFKTVKDDAGNECLVIFIPRSDLAPHRVGDWKMDDKKRILGRYYGRSGTSSVPLPENIVRAMYISRGRIPRVSVYTEVSSINGSNIQLRTIATPDPQRYISQYYNSNQIAIIDSSFTVTPDEDGNLWQEIHGLAPDSQHNPIYPKQEPYELLASMILNDEEDENEYQESNSFGLPAMPAITPMTIPHMDGDLHLTPNQFAKIFAIATKSNFSCDSVPLVTRSRLYILGSSSYWNFSDYDIARMDILKPIESRFNVEIYVGKPYRKGLRDDSEVREVAADGELRTSQITQVLEILGLHSHD